MTSRSPTLAIALAAAIAAACSKKPEEARPATTPAPATGATWTMRDLAQATALDARLARVTLAVGDVQALLLVEQSGAARPAAAAAEGRAALLAALDQAVAEAERALAAVGPGPDRAAGQEALAAAREYAGRLAGAVREERAVVAAELFQARDRLGAAIEAYRVARSGRRLDAPDPQGAEREFAEARRDMERTETAFASRTRVAPREEGHEFDPAAARMTGLMAADRAKTAAAKLEPVLAGPATRYAAAEARALEAVTGLAQAPEAERAKVARRYHEAKADALAALADYFAALASRATP